MLSSNDDLSALLIAVRNDVMRETQRQQVPWELSALTGRFYFKETTIPPAPVAPQPQDLPYEIGCFIKGPPGIEVRFYW
jgi:uncharacterized caspase-like protein